MDQNIEKMFVQAIQAFQNGNTGYAKSLLSIILKTSPNFPPALQVMGLIFASNGHADEAVKYLSRAEKFSPHDPGIQYNLAKALDSLGRNQEAISHHLIAIKLAPSNPDVWLNYGMSLSKLGKTQEALDAFEKSIVIEPNYSEAYLNAGLAFLVLAKYVEAEKSFERSLELKPNLVEAWVAMGKLQKELNKYDAALKAYLTAYKFTPSNFDICMNLGLLYSCKEDSVNALKYYLEATKVNPEKFQGWINLGSTYLQLEEVELAFSATQKGLDLNPVAINGLTNLGLILLRLERFDEAIELNKKAIALDPSNADAFANIGLTYFDRQKYENASESLGRALMLDPNYQWLKGMLIHSNLNLMDWQILESLVQQLLVDISLGKPVTPPFAALNLTDDLGFHLEVAKIWVNKKIPIQNSNPHSFSIKSIHQKLKIAYFSSDFKNHPVGNLMKNIIRNHEKTQFESIGVFLNRDENASDLVTRDLMHLFDQSINISIMPPDAAIAALRDMNIDIAIDLNGHTSGSRADLFSKRIAPVQINFLGYAGTLGADFYEYIIGDRFVIPEKNYPFYCEKIAYMPDCFFPADGSIDLTSSRYLHSKASQGLPNEGFVFACFNNAFKITPQIFAVWMKLLDRVPNSILWMSRPNDVAANNLKREAIKFGIDPNRIIYANRMDERIDHLSRLSLADLFLDTPNYNAHTTASDALWAGLPVLTISGESFASRVAGSQLNALGLQELITYNLDDYSNKAYQLATDPTLMLEVKNKLKVAKENSHLFNSTKYTKDLEGLYKKMYSQYSEGKPFENLLAD